VTVFHVAGRLVTTDIDLGPLVVRADPDRHAMPLPSPGSASERLLFGGVGLVAGAQRRVRCSHARGWYRIALEGVGRFAVAADGSVFTCQELAPEADHALVAEAALGPPLMLALALQGVFCLHASGVAGTGGVLVFLGSSGAGKSTLARQLSEAAGAGWQRVADDLLAVEVDAEGIWALPHLPQPKLTADEQPALTQPGRLPLQAVFVLEPTQAEGACVAVGRLTPTEAVLALASNTVAGRLFDRHLRSRHFEACGDCARRVPVSRLVYPWRPESFAAVDRLIRASLERPQGAGVTGD